MYTSSSKTNAQCTGASEATGQVSQDNHLKRFSKLYGFPKGVELFRQGFEPTYVYYVEAGLVKHVYCHEDGREVITNLVKPRCLLGASAAMLKEPHPVSAVTVQRCRLRCISASEFLEVMATSHQLSLLVNCLLSREVSNHLIHAAELATVDARFRLLQLLREMALGHDQIEQRDSVRLQLPIKQSELAELIAVTPQYLSHLLKQLEEDGVLERGKGSLIIINPEVLRYGAVG